MKIVSGTNRKGILEVESTDSIKDVEGNDMVIIGKYKIPMDQFLSVVEYVLENTDALVGDERIDFMDRVRGYRIVRRYNSPLDRGSRRIELYRKER